MTQVQGLLISSQIRSKGYISSSLAFTQNLNFNNSYPLLVIHAFTVQLSTVRGHCSQRIVSTTATHMLLITGTTFINSTLKLLIFFFLLSLVR